MDQVSVPSTKNRRSLIFGGLSCFALASPGWTLPLEKPDPGREVSEAQIASLVNEVSLARLEETVARLTAFPTRWTEAPAFPAVEDWLEAAFLGAGGLPVSRQSFQMPNGDLRHNILAGPTQAPEGIILIGAHFDSVSETPHIHAPGANDNASGVAAIIEALRVLSGTVHGERLLFVGFAGEEQGFLGSRAMAQRASREAWPIRLMINVDMLGARPATSHDPMIVEYDQGNRMPGNDADAARAGAVAAQMMARWSTLRPVHTNIWGSDYMPFEAIGVPCIGFFDGGTEESGYHTTRDTMDRLDFDRIHQATRALVATLITLAAGGV